MAVKWTTHRVQEPDFKIVKGKQSDMIHFTNIIFCSVNFLIILIMQQKQIWVHNKITYQQTFLLPMEDNKG